MSPSCRVLYDKGVPNIYFSTDCILAYMKNLGTAWIDFLSNLKLEEIAKGSGWDWFISFQKLVMGLLFLLNKSIITLCHDGNTEIGKGQQYKVCVCGELKILQENSGAIYAPAIILIIKACFFWQMFWQFLPDRWPVTFDMSHTIFLGWRIIGIGSTICTHPEIQWLR